MTDNEIINIGDVCAYSFDNANKGLSVVEIVNILSDEVVVVKFHQVICDDSGNGYFTYLSDTGKTMNVSKKYLTKIDLINRLKSANEKNERIIELADKTIKVQSAEIERLQKESESKEKAYNKEYVLRKELKAENEKVREANRFYERSRLNCQILTLEAFAKNLKNVFVNSDGTFECQEIEDLIDDFLNRTVNEAKKDYRAICQDDKSSYDLINKTKSEAIKEFAELYESVIEQLLTSATIEQSYIIYKCLDKFKALSYRECTKSCNEISKESEEMVGDDNATH